MNTVLIKEIGIHPWEQLYYSKDENFITITLLNQDYENAWETWCKFSLSLTQRWPKIVQWHTKLTPYFSKSQEYLALKKFAANSTSGDILKKDESTGIYSRITLLNPDPFKIDRTQVACLGTSITLMQKQNSANLNTWTRLSKLGYISTIEDIKLVLADKLSISFSFYNTETHGAAQLICHSEHLPFLNKIIKEMYLEEIQQEGVYEYIHR